MLITCQIAAFLGFKNHDSYTRGKNRSRKEFDGKVEQIRFDAGRSRRIEQPDYGFRFV
jgi:hypothetical protein